MLEMTWARAETARVPVKMHGSRLRFNLESAEVSFFRKIVFARLF